MTCNHATDEFGLCVYRCDASIPNPLESKPMTKTPLEIADHILYYCIGDNCPCCDWSDEDRAALEAMSIDEADRITLEENPQNEEQGDDFENHVDGGRYDLSDDAEALASAGWGTDEDYFFGDTD